jgi:hypothetical protein
MCPRREGHLSWGRRMYWTARAQLEWAIMLCQRNHSEDQRRASPLLREAVHTAAEQGYAGIERSGTNLAVA